MADRNITVRTTLISPPLIHPFRDVISRLGRRAYKSDSDSRKGYYDCGQAPVTNVLQESMLSSLGDRCSFVPGVKPIKYKLFQVADLICTTTLIEKRLASGQRLTKSEDKFFGGPRLFKRNILKYLKRKEI